MYTFKKTDKGYDSEFESKMMGTWKIKEEFTEDGIKWVSLIPDHLVSSRFSRITGARQQHNVNSVQTLQPITLQQHGSQYCLAELSLVEIFAEGQNFCRVDVIQSSGMPKENQMLWTLLNFRN